MTVLIADADETIVKVVSDFLTERDFNTLPAFDLEQARQTLERFRIDAILLDIQMPDGLGTVLRHELQDGSYPKQIPVIILSACVDPDQLTLARESSLGPCFPNPPDLEFLYQNLLAVRDQSHVRSARNQ